MRTKEADAHWEGYRQALGHGIPLGLFVGFLLGFAAGAIALSLVIMRAGAR